MADFSLDPTHTEDLATLVRNRQVHSAQFLYTSAGGALDIVTPTITPGRQAIRVDWMEIDISASNAAYTHGMDMEFPAGHEYENHAYKMVDDFAGQAALLHQVIYAGGGGVVVPNGAIIRLTATNSVVDATFKVHMLYEII
jgi:hypothetical protein